MHMHAYLIPLTVARARADFPDRTTEIGLTEALNALRLSDDDADKQRADKVARLLSSGA